MSSSNTQDLPSLPSNGLMLTGSPGQLIGTSELLQRYCRRKGPIRGFENVSDVAPQDSCHSSDRGGGRQRTGGVASVLWPAGRASALRRWTDGAAGAASRCAIELLDVLASGAVISAAETETSLGISRSTPWRINFAWVIPASFTSTSTYRRLDAGRAVITVGAATERGTFRTSSTSHAAVAVECHCFKSSSDVDSVVASSELGDDLAEAFGVLAQKADVGQPLHRTVGPQRGGHIADGSVGSVGFCCHVKIISCSPLQQNPSTSSAHRLKRRLVGGDHSQVPLASTAALRSPPPRPEPYTAAAARPRPCAQRPASPPTRGVSGNWQSQGIFQMSPLPGAL